MKVDLFFQEEGIRSEKRLIHKAVQKASKKTQNCTRRSRRSKKVHRAKRKVIRRAKRRIRDLRHKTTTSIVKILKEKNVGKVFVGNPNGVRKKNSGKKQNQRLMGWEYGKDFEYLSYTEMDSKIGFSAVPKQRNSSIINDPILIILGHL